MTGTRDEKGAAMIAALAVLVFLGILGGAVTARHALLRREVEASVREAQASALAEAGLARARVALAVDPSWSGEGPTPLGEGTFHVRVDEAGIASEGRVPGRPRPGRVLLTARRPAR